MKKNIVSKIKNKLVGNKGSSSSSSGSSNQTSGSKKTANIHRQ